MSMTADAGVGERPGPVVETAQGKVRGILSGGAHIFRGIPYAAPPSGANRFRQPVEADGWSGIRSAVRFGCSAPQPTRDSDPIFGWYSSGPAADEDCLFLNIYSPSSAPDRDRPVMFWIHGGNWFSGSGSAPGFDARRLAVTEDVVVVTVNHRLNLFGYLQIEHADERFDASANVGMLDLVQALRWAQQNIAAFGGDPNNVTIFGQSGGAAKVLRLLAMPATHGLVHKAIAQSCSGVLRFCGQDEARELSHRLALELGLSNADGPALQDVPMNVLVAAYERMNLSPFRPVYDPRLYYCDGFDPAQFPAHVPTMIGTTTTEAALYMSHDIENFSLDAAEVHRRVARFLTIDKPTTDDLIETYRAHAPDSTPSELLVAIATDFVYRRNTLEAANRLASSGPVYAYMFNWSCPALGGVLKSPHTSEVPFIFGTTAQAQALLGHGPDIAAMEHTMMATWAAFARHADPNTSVLPPWPEYDPTTKKIMVIDEDSQVLHDPGAASRHALDPLPHFEYNMPSNYVRP